MDRRFLLGSLAGVFAALIWGLWPVITRYGVITSFRVEEIVLVRFLFAGFLLLPYYLKRKVYKRISPIRSFIIASGAGAVYVYVSALGLKFAPAGHLGIVGTGTMLALSALGGYLFLGESKNKTQILGYAAVLLGMMIVNWQGFSMLASSNIILGDLLLVLGGVLWASYTVLYKKWDLNAWDAVATVCVWSLFLWVPFILLFRTIHFHPISWLYQGIGQGVIAAILGLWLYTVAVNFLGAARGSLFGALVPAIAILGGWIFLTEIPTIIEVIGVSLTTVGVAISLRK